VRHESSVRNAIKSALIKYQDVKKKDSIVKKLQVMHKEIEEATT
jgi:hypothetical protein